MVRFNVEQNAVSLKVKHLRVPMSVGQGRVAYQGGTPYAGAYSVTPDVVSQSLPTQGKLLSRDVCVEEIPLYEVSNQQNGTTAVIGGIKYAVQ